MSLRVSRGILPNSTTVRLDVFETAVGHDLDQASGYSALIRKTISTAQALACQHAFGLRNVFSNTANTWIMGISLVGVGMRRTVRLVLAFAHAIRRFHPLASVRLLTDSPFRNLLYRLTSIDQGLAVGVSSSTVASHRWHMHGHTYRWLAVNATDITTACRP